MKKIRKYLLGGNPGGSSAVPNYAGAFSTWSKSLLGQNNTNNMGSFISNVTPVPQTTAKTGQNISQGTLGTSTLPTSSDFLTALGGLSADGVVAAGGYSWQWLPSAQLKAVENAVDLGSFTPFKDANSALDPLDMQGWLSDIDAIKPKSDISTSTPIKSDIMSSSDILKVGLDATEGLAKGLKLKDSGLTKGAKAGGIASAAGQAADIIGGFIPNRPEYDGDYGNITLTLDTAYNTAADGLMATGTPWGMIAGGAMKVGGMLNKGVGALGGGTDGMTGTDAVLGSNFLGLTPVGLINGFGGKRADTFNKNNEAFAMSMGSYGGTEALADDAAHKSGKKYGLFSSGARRRANQTIAEAKRQLNIMADIVDEALDLRELAASMNQVNALNYKYNIDGTYDDPYAMRAARNGMKLELARNLLKTKPTKKEEIIEPVIEPSYVEYIPIKEEGGTLEIKIEPTYIDLLPADIEKFLKGGSINVIPEGALHAHKHHMENAEHLTKKGIPVVDNDGEQQAEVERLEVIFRLSVTEKLEELQKVFYSDESSNKEKEDAALEAGKLLVYEILYNTEDKTNELL